MFLSGGVFLLQVFLYLIEINGGAAATATAATAFHREVAVEHAANIKQRCYKNEENDDLLCHILYNCAKV